MWKLRTIGAWHWHDIGSGMQPHIVGTPRVLLSREIVQQMQQSLSPLALPLGTESEVPQPRT